MSADKWTKVSDMNPNRDGYYTVQYREFASESRRNMSCRFENGKWIMHPKFTILAWRHLR